MPETTQVKFFAHSVPGRPCEEWEPLEDHLKAVAAKTAEFAAAFGAKEWGRLAGLWHGVHENFARQWCLDVG